MITWIEGWMNGWTKHGCIDATSYRIQKMLQKLLHIKVINNEHNDFVKGYQGYQIGQQNWQEISLIKNRQVLLYM